MAIVRWNPVRGVVGLEDELRLLFGDFFGPGRAGDETRFVRWAPRVDIAEENGNYELTAEKQPVGQTVLIQAPGQKFDPTKIVRPAK